MLSIDLDVGELTSIGVRQGTACMPISTEHFYRFLETSCRTGVTSKLLPLIDQALVSVMSSQHITVEDLFYLLDNASPATLEDMDRKLAKSDIKIRLLASNWIARMFSRILDIRVIQRAVTRSLINRISKAIEEERDRFKKESLNASEGQCHEL